MFLFNAHSTSRDLSRLSGAISVLLGLTVLFGWYSHITALIQISSTFVPMQFNTALGFFLCGVGLLSATFDHRLVAFASGVVVAFIGAMTLIQYGLNLDLGIDQLFMEHYVTVKTSHPGRMAPNTALCFTLAGTALAVGDGIRGYSRTLIITGSLGSLVFGLGGVALSGYVVGLETAYGWGNLTRMAVHTSVGFMVHGTGMVALAWYRNSAVKTGLPDWLPVPIGIAVLTATVALWQAITLEVTGGTITTEQTQVAEKFAPNLILLFGIVLAAALASAVRLAQAAKERTRMIEEMNRELKNEVVRRELAEKKIRMAHDELELRVEERTTELRKLTQAIEQSPAIVVITDTNGTIEYINPKFEEITGYSSEEAIGRNPRFLKSGETPAEKYDELWKAISSGREWRGEFRDKRKDGRLFWEAVLVSPIKTPDGTITNYLAVGEDITERKRSELILAETEKMRASAQITAGVAHHFNNLLAVVLGTLELLRQKITNDENAVNLIDRAINASQRGGKLTQQLLSFSRNQLWSPDIVNVNDEVSEQVPILQQTLGSTVQIKTQLEENLPNISIDRKAFQNAIQAIADNAGKAMPKGGILRFKTETTNLTTQQLDDELSPGIYAVLTISDDGCGMAQEALERAFEPFFTTGEFSTETGLGLSMVYGLVKQSAGKIVIESEVNKGTSVSMFLPVVGEID